jgi:hypothetical protein
VPIVAAAVCPHPPLLVPRLAAGAAPELQALRAACDAAVAALLARSPDLLVVVGVDAATRRLDPPYGACFAAWGGGADRRASSDAPLSLLVGAWLLGRQPVSPPLVRMQAVAAAATAAQCAELGERISAEAERVALLVMGDGSSRRTEKAPGYADPRAEPFDGEVAQALAEADPGRLRAIDAGLAAELMAAGRAPWQVLAGAAAGGSWSGLLCYAQAPYGVGYFVASWRGVPAVATVGSRAGRAGRS